MIVFRGRRTQKGAGIASIFRGLFKSILPATRSAAQAGIKMIKKVDSTPQAKNLARGVKHVMRDSAIDLTADILSGQNVKDSAKANLGKAKTRIANNLKRSVLELKEGPLPPKKRHKQQAVKKKKVKRKAVKYNLLA